MNNVLVISLKELEPVRSGFQNTVFCLCKSLQSKFKVKFLYFNNSNLIDPVLNLEFDYDFSKKIENYIENFSPKYIFINTTKLLSIYKKLFLQRKERIVLVCHDLYHFRKEYFRKNKFFDNSELNSKDEIKLLSYCNYIIDLSDYEYKYLLKNNIKRNKICLTKTPVKVHNFKYSKKRKYTYFFIGSNWIQNSLSVNVFFKRFRSFFTYKKVRIVGSKPTITFPHIYFSKELNKEDDLDSKIGLAPIYEGTGRNVKIFSMMSYSLPVITNKDLSVYGLKNNFHYVKVDSFKNWEPKLKKLENSYSFRKFIALNGWKFVNQNNNYKLAFKELIEKL